MSQQAFIADGAIYIYNVNTLALEIWTGEVTTTAGPGGGLTDAELRASAVPVSIAAAVAVTSATFATSAKQDTLQTAVDAINTKTPALGQALAASSTPVVLTAIQVAALTPPAAIVGFGLEATQLSVKTAVETIATNGATAANQTTEIAALATLATEATLATLAVAQGATSTDQVGPLMQALVNESPSSYETETVQPLSMTNQGRLRVSTVEADVTQVWQHTFESPWASDNPWEMKNPYV